MSALIIDGKAIANKVRDALKQRTEKLAQLGLQPGLAVILVGDNPASGIYVRNKEKACKEAGIHSEIYQFPGDTSQMTVLEHIHTLNHDPKIHGILIQLPLPAHFDTQKIIESIAIEKDVDGFHPCNVGALATGNARFYPCTPYGVMTLLKEFNLIIALFFITGITESRIQGFSGLSRLLLIFIEICIVIVPIFILINTVKTIAGERDSNILEYMLSFPISLKQYYWEKILGRFITVFLPVFFD